MRDKICGVYGILNTETGKWYVGQAVDIERRWGRHLRELKYGYHHNAILQKSYDKHGPDAFSFVLLEECPVDTLGEREIFWIAKKDSFENGYNLNRGGDGGNLGWKMPEEVKRKIAFANSGERSFWYGKKQPESANKKRREALLGPKNHNFGKTFSEETRRKLHDAHVGRNPPNKRPVRCIETGVIYESAKKAAAILGVDHSTLTKCCRGERNICGGCHWEVVTDE